MEDVKDLYDRNFIRCYKLYSGMIMRFLNGMIMNKEISEDLTHDVFLKLYEKRKIPDPDTLSSKSFLMTVAKNQALDYLKRKKLENVKFKEKLFTEATLDKQFFEDVEKCYINGEVVSTVHDMINSFPEKQKEVLVERIFSNKKRAAVSRKMDISPYSIRKIEREINYRLRGEIQSDDVLW